MSSSIQLTRAQFICFALATASAAVMLTLSIISTPFPSQLGNSMRHTMIGLSIFMILGALATPFWRVPNPQSISPIQRLLPLLLFAIALFMQLPSVLSVFEHSPERWREHLHHVTFLFSPITIGLMMAGSMTFAPRKEDSAASHAATQP
jgi:uncharacterized membrane protein YfcA